MDKQKTCFIRVDYDLDDLLTYIDNGNISLPDIQRPFVWKNTRVRDLLDSMYRGFPVGYLLFWKNTNNSKRTIGLEDKQHSQATHLIVDGQQRLTSLYSVLRGKAVLGGDYKSHPIEIAFNPWHGKFAVADAAIQKNPKWISNISEIWTSGVSTYTLVNDYVSRQSNLEQTSEEPPKLDEHDQELIAKNIERLYSIRKYSFTALEIAEDVDEEKIAEIFVRINSEGVKLNQADFILTLLSVFWEEGRSELEKFCRESHTVPTGDEASPFNHFISPNPDQLLRVAIAYGFNRGRLKSVYQILRSKNPETGNYLVEHREEQFNYLKDAQAHVLNLTNWHQFLKSLVGAGFQSKEIVSSQNALLFAYAFYLLGKVRFKISEHELQKSIGRWFFVISITGRYTSSPETALESDLARFREVESGEEFFQVLDEISANVITNDFWEITLPANLERSATRNPGAFAYIATQIQLNTPVLFSNKSIASLFDSSIRAKKKALERHHLFPRRWLETEAGIDDLREINQVANYALLEWPDNIDIGDAPPHEYVPKLRERFSDTDWKTMSELHALPDNWETMNYSDFLGERRKLMAKIIRRGYEKLR